MAKKKQAAMAAAAPADDIDVLAENLSLQEMTALTNQLRASIRRDVARLAALKAAFHRKDRHFAQLRKMSPADMEQMLAELLRNDDDSEDSEAD